MKKVLIANRGEIACRIIRALKDLGIYSVAVFSEADKHALHVKMADEAICIGPSKSLDSYLNISRIIAACEISGADAVHPGYGFLSENAFFAEVIERSGLTFIGPSSGLIKLLGNKIEAKKIAKTSGCPTIPGTPGRVDTLEEGLHYADKIGYPVFIKASAGGGGKGIRIAQRREEFEENFKMAKEEAMISFSDDAIYLEKMIVDPKHIEIQIAADKNGNTIHLYERDCSLQRRRQKLIEETLSPSLSSKLREEICLAAVNLMKVAKYNSVGTVEFLLDRDDNFYFMEVNTRIQVEHTVTEELTGIDLVALQINIARNIDIKISQEQINCNGHVMEFRINAENPKEGFRPSPGILSTYIPPLGPNVRVDTALYQGVQISPYYDSMIAKIIVKGVDRTDVINRSKRILKEFYIEGVETTIPFHLWVLEQDPFLNHYHNILYIDSITEKKVGYFG